MERRTPVWQAPEDVLDLMGDVSGNELNGWDEPEKRQPTLVMWANPAKLAHGAIQTRMTEEFVAHRELRTLLRMGDRHEPAPVARDRIERTPSDWVQAVTNFATSADGQGVDLVGIAVPQSDWFFEGRSSELPWVIMLALAMDHEQLATAPEYTSAMEVHRQYNRCTAAARSLADWIRSQGFEAEGHGGPGAGPMQMVPAAMSAGLGELAKHGSIINRQLGSSFRLAAVLTDLPLVASKPDAFAVDDFCYGCRICTDACPPDAIAPAKRLVRGSTKWAVDFDRCLPYFAESYGCGICIAVCPWSTPGAAPRLAETMLRKQQNRESTNNL